MLPKIATVKPLENYKLLITMLDGRRFLYDVSDDIVTLKAFAPLKTEYKLFEQVQIDSSKTCIYWSDEIDLPSDTLVEYGKQIA